MEEEEEEELTKIIELVPVELLLMELMVMLLLVMGLFPLGRTTEGRGTEEEEEGLPLANLTKLPLPLLLHSPDPGPQIQ